MPSLRSPERHSFNNMKDRCTNPKRLAYKRYGARGITICDRWQGKDGFANFIADMGPRPEGTTLDRRDNDGNYEPTNCRWATKSVQQRNRRTSIVRTPVDPATIAPPSVGRWAEPSSRAGRSEYRALRSELRRTTSPRRRTEIEARLDSLCGKGTTSGNEDTFPNSANPNPARRGPQDLGTLLNWTPDAE